MIKCMVVQHRMPMLMSTPNYNMFVTSVVSIMFYDYNYSEHIYDNKVLILFIGVALLTLWLIMQPFKTVPQVVSVSTIKILTDLRPSTFTAFPPSASNVFQGSFNVMFLPAHVGREQVIVTRVILFATVLACCKMFLRWGWEFFEVKNV